MAIEKNHPIIYNILQKLCQNVNSLKMSENTFLGVPKKCAIPHKVCAIPHNAHT